MGTSATPCALAKLLGIIRLAAAERPVVDQVGRRVKLGLRVLGVALGLDELALVPGDLPLLPLAVARVEVRVYG
jgi:hypothetical protein